MSADPTPFPPRPSAPGAVAPVTPHPVPTNITLGQVQSGDGRSWVMLQFASPTGLGVYFLDGESALQIGHQLRTLGRAAKTGLTIPDGVHLNGDGK